MKTYKGIIDCFFKSSFNEPTTRILSSNEEDLTIYENIKKDKIKLKETIISIIQTKVERLNSGELQLGEREEILTTISILTEILVRLGGSINEY